MKNVQLIAGKCPICGGNIDEQWAGKDPTIGTTCRGCFDKKDQLFGPENVEIAVTKSVVFNPLFGMYEYELKWYGTKVMINGIIGQVQSACLGSCWVKFPDEPEWGDSIGTLDYWLLKKIYEKTGGDTKPPPLDLKPHTPTKAPLLDAPIFPVDVDMDKHGNITQTRVRRRGEPLGRPPVLPILPMLHAFCNLFVRYKFGLEPLFACEGGFIGRDFEARNAGLFRGCCGLTVQMNQQKDTLKYVNNEADFRALASEIFIAAKDVHGERSKGVIKGASAHQVLSVWVNLMETLLKYDWTKRKFKNTCENIYEGYCLMQNILANVLTPDDLAAALDYAKKKGEIVHCGNPY